MTQKETHKEKILRILRNAGSCGVSSYFFDNRGDGNYIKRAAARIEELRKSGYQIPKMPRNKDRSTTYILLPF